ncbi:MAG: beta strand repeat-containing protein, partial [Chloroflexota bacterium]
VPDSVGGTVTVTVQVPGGNPVNLVTANPYGRTVNGTDPAWITPGQVTIPNGREVTIGATATDRAIPVPNVASVSATAHVVDTVPPVVTLTNPKDASRLSAPSGTLDVPVTGGSEPFSTVDLRLRRIDTDPTQSIFEEILPATSTFGFRFPATGGTNLGPGTYQLTARATDAAGNPGQVATSTFQITPPPPAAVLEVPGTNGKVGQGDDADPDTDGVQIVLRGHLPDGTTAGQVPDGLVARLIRNGKDALGDGNRPVITPVNPTDSGAYTFAFPALSFRADATAEYTVVTSDDAGNRSAVSNPVTLTVDLTAPSFTVATPRDGATVGTLRPELAAVIAPSGTGTYDTTRVTFEVRKTASPTFRLIRDIQVDPTTLASTFNPDGAGVVRVKTDDWAEGDSLDPVESPITENYVLRITASDDVGNIRAASSTFTLKPGVPSVSITQADTAVLGTIDVTGETPPVIGVTATVTGDGVTLRSITATIRNRAGTTTPIPVTGSGATRTFDFTAIPLPNGTIHDLIVTATDSNGRSATAGATVRIVRPRDLAVTVRRGGSAATGTMVILRRDGGDLPGIDATSGAFDVTTDNSGVATFTGIPGGPVLIAVKGVPGYPVTTVAADITEPHASATAPWAFTIDLDSLNPNIVTTTLRGLPITVTGSASLSSLVTIDVIAPTGAQFSDATIDGTTSPLVHTFGNTIATVDRQVTPAPPVTTGTVVTTTTHLPRGAVAWRVIPTLSGSAADDAKIKGASEATAVFGSGTSGETVPVSFRYAATNLRVKSLSGTITRPDHSAVSGATVVIAQPGGLSVTTTSTLEGTFGPVLLEAGDYIVTAVASAGSDWLPGRAGRISFASSDPPVPETGTVDLTVLAAGGTVQARVTRAVSGGTATLATGKVVLNGQGQVITATASAALLPGQDGLTGPNVTIAAPSGIYVLTVVPDDGSLTPPDPLTIRVIDGKTRTITAVELPPMEKTLGRLTGLVRLTTGEPLAGLTVQARRDGEASVIPATTDDAGIYSVAAPAGSYIVSAVIPRGASLLPGNAMAAVVTPRTTTTVGDLAIAAAAATIERNLVKTGGSALTALTEDEAAGLSGTAFVKNLATGAGTSITFTGTRVRMSVPAGTYRLGIAITAGGFLAPEAETGIVATASAPNVATRTVTPSNIPVTGQLVTGQTDGIPGTNVPLRTVVRATGTSGPASGVVNLTESTAGGAFTFALAPGTWRLAASPDASQGFLTNPDRPYTMITVGADGSVIPASPGIDLRAASRTVTGTATVSINGTDVPLAGVKVRLEIIGASGGALSLTQESDRDGLFSFAAPTGTATISASGASARYGTSTGGMTADDSAYVIDPVPAGVPDTGAPVALRFTNASIKVAGTVATGDGRNIGGVTVSATSDDGLVRTATTSGGSLPGRYEFRLSPGIWHLIAATEITRTDGSRVPAASVDTPVTVISADQTGQTLTLIESAIELPPSATAGADPDSGGQVRAGRDSAELLLAPNAVSEAVNVSIDPLGNVPSVPGFYPFGDAFRIGATTVSSSQAVGTLAVDSTVKITYSRTTLAKYSATSNQVPASATDLRAALFDASTSSYTAFDGAVATVIDDTTGQFVISTTNLGTFVLTTRNALTRIPAIVTGVTASPSSGTLRTGATVTITVAFSQPVTVVTSGGTPRIAMGTGANGAARDPATYATYASGSGTTSLAFIYTVASGDTASDLDYASTTSLEANGGTIRNADGFDATLTLAQPGQTGSISVGNAIVIDTTSVPVTPVPETGGGGGGGPTTTTPATTTKPVTVTPAQTPPSTPATVPSGVTPPTPATTTPEVAARAERALASVDASTRKAYDTLAASLDPAERAALTASLASMPADRVAAYIANLASLPGTVKIATGGTSGVASDGTVTTSFDVDDEDPAPAARVIDGADVAGVRVATNARRTVVVIVPAGQRALINRGRSGTWPNIALPLPAGAQAGLTPLLSLPADATSLRFDPTPANLNVVQQGSLGGGIVTPLAGPFAIAVTAPQAPDATVDLSLPSVEVGPGQAFGYLFSVNAPDGSFFGYLRAPARFDPSTGRQTWQMTAKALETTLFMPVALTPAYVQNFSADTHIHSGPDASAVDFGVAGPAFTTFTVVGPQMGNRIYVYSPVTKGYGWVDASGVGPSGPPGADAQVPVTSPPATDATTGDTDLPPVDAPDATPSGTEPATPTRTYVRTLMATARLFSSPYDDAADFGPVGQASVILVVIEGPVNGHLYVYNPTTKNY